MIKGYDRDDRSRDHCQEGGNVVGWCDPYQAGTSSVLTAPELKSMLLLLQLLPPDCVLRAPREAIAP